jgi:hypothetical protein
MRNLKTHFELEGYFAKNYTKKYIEFGGCFVPLHLTILRRTPMQKYFYSGKYKELQDKHLEELWLKVRWAEYHEKLIGIGFILLIIAYQIFK